MAASATYCAGPVVQVGADPAQAALGLRGRAGRGVDGAAAQLDVLGGDGAALADLRLELGLLPGDGPAAGADDAEEHEPAREETPGDEEPALAAGVGEVALEVGRHLVELGDGDDLARPDLVQRRVDLEERQPEGGLARRSPGRRGRRSCR